MATHSSVLAWETPWTEEPGKTTVHGVAESDTTEATKHTPAMPLATAQCSAPSPGLNPSLWNLDAGLLTGRVQWLPTAPRVRSPSHPAPCTPHTLCIAEGTPRTSASDQRHQGHTGEREERCAEGLLVQGNCTVWGLAPQGDCWRHGAHREEEARQCAKRSVKRFQPRQTGVKPRTH